MRLLHILPSLRAQSGGPSRSVPQLCRALHHEGLQLTLLTGRRPGEAQALKLEDAGFPVRCFDWRFSQVQAAVAIARFMRQQRESFDLVHIHSVWNSVVTQAAAAARALGKPYIICPRGMLDRHNLQRGQLKKWLYRQTFDRHTVAGAAALHCLNAAEAHNLSAEWFRLPKIFVSPNGVDARLLTWPRGNFRKAHPEYAGKRLVVFLGRLHAIKGLALQRQALEAVRARHPDTLWLLVGPDDGEWAKLQGPDWLRWLGPIDSDARFDLLADADLLLQTSEYEGHSVAVNEALAVGTPVVIVDTVHFDEVAQVGAGFVTAREPGAIADAAARVLADGALQQTMRANAQGFAARELAWPAIARGMLGHYDRLLGGRAP